MSPRALAAGLAAAAVLVLPTTGAIAATGDDEGLPFVDRRAAVDVPDRTASARRGLDRALGTTGVVRTDRRTGGVALVGRTDGLLTGPSSDPADEVVRRYVLAHPEVFGLDAGDLDALRPTQRFTDAQGVTHLRWVQVVDGIEAFDAGLIAQVARDGRLISVSGGAVGDPRLPSTRPGRSATAGLGDARRAADGSGIAPATTGGTSREATFTTGESTRLRWLATADGELLVWQSFVEGEDGQSYDVLTDADSGALVRRQDLTEHAVDTASWRSDPRGDVTFEPLPDAWFADSAGGTRLWGQYARTYGDPQDADPAPGSEGSVSGGFQIPASSPSPLAFSFGLTPGDCPGLCTTWSDLGAPTLGGTVGNRSPAGVSSHVATSRFLAWLGGAPVGFTAASGGFSGDDYVRNEIHDGALRAGGGYPTLNNANFATFPDGTPPRMQMYLWAPPATDSALDAAIVYHEVAHGLSNRLVVNAAGSSTITSFQGRMMGEAWSDFYALAMLHADGLLEDTPAVGDQTLADWVAGTGDGIRAKPIDCPVNASNVVAACNRVSSGRPAVTGGYTYADLALTQNVSPHNGGEVWAQTLWDLKNAIGWTEALALTTGGMRLAPASPSMLDLRDAMLRYAVAIRSAQGAVDDRYDELWTVFAARGLGAAAFSPSSSSTSPVESFAIPDDAVLGARTLTDPYPGGDGDGFLEPGEVVRIDQDVLVRRFAGATDLVATLTTGAPSSQVELVDPTSSFGPLAGGETRGSGADPLAVKLGSALPCEASVPITVTIDSSQTAPTAGSFGVGGPRSGPRGEIPDGVGEEIAGAPLDLTWTATGSGTVTDVDVRLDDLRHTWPGDLVIQLIHNGTTRTLLSRPAGANWDEDNFAGVVFDDEAATGFPPTAVANLFGRFRPSQTLSAFDGLPVAGEWTLRIRDFYDGDSGSVERWGLDGNGQTTCRLEIPAAATGEAGELTATTATVDGTVTPNGRATGWRVAYGTSPSYGATTPTQAVGAGDAAEQRIASLTGLQPSTTYHYRVEAIREGGRVAVAGADRTFTTPAAPPADPPAPPSDPPAATPPAGGTGTIPAVAPPVVRPPALAAPTLSLTRRGVLTLGVRTTPRARALVRLTVGRRTLVSRTVTASRAGRATIRLTLSPSARRALRGKRSVKVTYSVTVGGRSQSRTVTLRVPAGLR